MTQWLCVAGEEKSSIEVEGDTIFTGNVDRNDTTIFTGEVEEKIARESVCVEGESDGDGDGS